MPSILVEPEDIRRLVANVAIRRQTHHLSATGSSVAVKKYEVQPPRPSTGPTIHRPPFQLWQLRENCIISEPSEHASSSEHDTYSTTSSEPTTMTVPTVRSDDEQPTRHPIRCEFWPYDGCPEIFDTVSAFVFHCLAHHREPLPPVSICWYCDDWIFETPSDRDDLRWQYYCQRLQHIGEHHYLDDAPGPMRPDEYVLRHLYNNDEISSSLYRSLNDEESNRLRGIIARSRAEEACGASGHEEQVAGRRGRDRREAHERRNHARS